jgi:propanol-preferring alcohol dehydrogenase
MKAAILNEFKEQLSIEEVARPAPGAHEVLIELQACGVGHSDLHVANGDWPQIVPITQKPLILGHEIIRSRCRKGRIRRSFGARGPRWRSPGALDLRGM